MSLRNALNFLIISSILWLFQSMYWLSFFIENLIDNGINHDTKRNIINNLDFFVPLGLIFVCSKLLNFESQIKKYIKELITE